MQGTMSSMLVFFLLLSSTAALRLRLKASGETASQAALKAVESIGEATSEKSVLDFESILDEGKVKYQPFVETFHGGCSNYEEVSIEPMATYLKEQNKVGADYTREECYDMCTKIGGCAGFAFGGKAQYGAKRCIPLRYGCKNDKNKYYRYYEMKSSPLCPGRRGGCSNYMDVVIRQKELIEFIHQYQGTLYESTPLAQCADLCRVFPGCAGFAMGWTEKGKLVKEFGAQKCLLIREGCVANNDPEWTYFDMKTCPGVSMATMDATIKTYMHDWNIAMGISD